MTTRDKTKNRDIPFTKNNICENSEALDIILFCNKNTGITGNLIKFGTNSDYNHAALVMDSIPTCKNEASIKSDETINGTTKYLYEYAGIGQPVTYQKLEDKLEKEEFNSIHLIRFKRISRVADDEILKNAKNTVKDDFCKRGGYSAEDWKGLSEKKGVSESVKYFIFGIIHRATMTLSLLAAIFVYFLVALILVLIAFYVDPKPLGPWLLYSLILMGVFATLWIIACFVYNKKNKDTKNKREICSTYPPAVLKLIMFDEKTERDAIDTFAGKWLNGTPPSPKDLYTLGNSSDDCEIINFKKDCQKIKG
ncbi:hypothetical protein ABN222_09900 [Providencia alcalifaciens]